MNDNKALLKEKKVFVGCISITVFVCVFVCVCECLDGVLSINFATRTVCDYLFYSNLIEKKCDLNVRQK